MADLLPLLTLAFCLALVVAMAAAPAYARSLSRRLGRARVRLVRATRRAAEAEGMERVEAEARVMLRQAEADDLARRLARVEWWVGRAS